MLLLPVKLQAFLLELFGNIILGLENTNEPFDLSGQNGELGIVLVLFLIKWCQGRVCFLIGLPHALFQNGPLLPDVRQCLFDDLFEFLGRQDKVSSLSHSHRI